MQRFLIFLLFISYISNGNCKRGIKLFGRWECPSGTELIQGECVKIPENLNYINETELIQGVISESLNYTNEKELIKGEISESLNYTNEKELIKGEISESLNYTNETELIKGEISECLNYTNRTELIQNEITERLNCPLGYIRLPDGSCIKIKPPIRSYTPIMVYKPVIYLYPEESMDISVQLNIKESKFTTIYPKFNEKNTWNIRAKPNGDILIKDKTYPYLFWEAESYISQETNEGFIVNQENAEKFLEGKLDILGLNEKEKTDFITFWLPILLRNKLSLCTFQTQKFFNNYELNITPVPDPMIRVFLTIKKLERPINIREQKLELVERKGFSVVEWGGSNI